MTEEHVHIGDVWRENDLRQERYVRVIRFINDDHVRIATCDRDGKVHPMTRPTRAKLSRFGKGYIRP